MNWKRPPTGARAPGRCARQPAGEYIERHGPSQRRHGGLNGGRVILAPADRRDRPGAGVEDQAAGPRRAPVAALDRGIDRGRRRGRAEGAARRARSGVIVTGPGGAEPAPTAPSGQGWWPAAERRPRRACRGQQRRHVLAGPPMAAVTPSRASGLSADGVVAAVQAGHLAPHGPLAGDGLVEREPGENGRRPGGDGDPPEAEQTSPKRDDGTPEMATYSYCKRLARAIWPRRLRNRDRELACSSRPCAEPGQRVESLP